jgi:hypothetical protein
MKEGNISIINNMEETVAKVYKSIDQNVNALKMKNEENTKLLENNNYHFATSPQYITKINSFGLNAKDEPLTVGTEGRKFRKDSFSI